MYKDIKWYFSVTVLYASLVFLFAAPISHKLTQILAMR